MYRYTSYNSFGIFDRFYFPSGHLSGKLFVMSAETPIVNIAIGTPKFDIAIPMPSFVSGDETSMILRWYFIFVFLNLNNTTPHLNNCNDIRANYPLKDSDVVSIQFKIPEKPWDMCSSLPVDRDGQTLCIKDSVHGGTRFSSLVNLEPGTPYCVRFAIEGESGTTVGRETVFDTKPIGCGPKSKSANRRCIVC